MKTGGHFSHRILDDQNISATTAIAIFIFPGSYVRFSNCLWKLRTIFFKVCYSGVYCSCQIFYLPKNPAESVSCITFYWQSTQ